MRSRFIRVLLVVLVVLITALPSACRRQAAHSEKVRIGCLTIANSLPLYVAIHRKIFEQKGLDVELVNFETSNDLVEALIAGRIEAEVSASTAVLFAMQNRAPGKIKIFSVNLQTARNAPDSIVVRADSGIQAVQDLEGKKIGIFPGSTFLVIARVILGAYISPATVTLEQIPPPAQLEALRSGAVDAIYTMEPFVTLAVHTANGRVLLEGAAERHILDPLPAGAAAISTTFLTSRPLDAQRLIAAFDEAIDQVRRDEGAARAILPQFTPLQDAIVKEIKVVEFWKNAEIREQPLRQYADFLKENGEFDKPVEVGTMIYRTK